MKDTRGGGPHHGEVEYGSVLSAWPVRRAEGFRSPYPKPAEAPRYTQKGSKPSRPQARMRRDICPVRKESV